MQSEPTLQLAAAKAGMDEKTARKYRRLGKLPSEVKPERTWRTREDPFSEVWDELRSQLEVNPGLEAKMLFEYLQRTHPGRFSDGQLRTFQRKVKAWRALEGPSKEIFFPQRYRPGELCQSDFTHMNKLGVTIRRQAFDHLVYHFVLPYSNWEIGMICFSESFESLSDGLQHALWELGGVPKAHRTDRLTTAIKKTAKGSAASRTEAFTERYTALLRHYRLEGAYTQAASPHENGDVEQRHHRFKRALEQALLLRGSRDFDSRDDYALFLSTLFRKLNAGRRDRLEEELRVLGSLPNGRLEACKRFWTRVGPSSTIRVAHNVYSVNSRLIKEKVEVRLYREHIELWYAQHCVERMPRLRGEGGHHIAYRHMIDWLVRKPGAFEHYRYRDALFPTHRFRMAYDHLKRRLSSKAHKEYLSILELAAKENEAGVDEALRQLIDMEEAITSARVEELLRQEQPTILVEDVTVTAVDLSQYDQLLRSPSGDGAASGDGASHAVEGVRC